MLAAALEELSATLLQRTHQLSESALLLVLQGKSTGTCISVDVATARLSRISNEVMFGDNRYFNAPTALLSLEFSHSQLLKKTLPRKLQQQQLEENQLTYKQDEENSEPPTVSTATKNKIKLKIFTFAASVPMSTFTARRDRKRSSFSFL